MKYSTILFILLLAGKSSVAQKPAMIDRYRLYVQSVLEDPSKKMLELKKAIPNIVYDLKYAGRNNFMKCRMYRAGTNETFMRKGAVLALAKVQKELNANGMGLKIFDAYRPWSVSKKFWDLIKDERYVANPVKGSNHNRGTAVDLTIIYLNTGKELNMGTGFDNFTDTAWHNFEMLPLPVLQNRELLKTIMGKYGFTAYNEEWWHYNFRSNVQFELLDIPFKKIRQ